MGMSKYEGPIFKLLGYALFILPWACVALIASCALR